MKILKKTYLLCNKKYVIWYILIIGGLLRLYKLGYSDFWYDEAFNVLTAGQLNFLSIKDTLSHIYRAQGTFLPTPPLFYCLLRIWIITFKITEANIRLLPAIFGILSILLIYKTGKKFLNERVGLYSAFLYAISPLHIWYAQEVAQYQMAVFLILLKFYFLMSALKENKKTFWILFSITTIFLFYTNYFSLLIIVPEFITLFFLKISKQNFKLWFLSYGVTLMSFLPIIAIFINTFSLSTSFWLPQPTLRSILITFENFNLGYNSFNLLYKISLIIFAIPILNVLLKKRDFPNKAVILQYFLLPIFFTFFISTVVTPIYIDRQLMLFSPFYYLLMAWGLSSFKKYSNISYLIIMFILLISFASLSNYYSNKIPYENKLHHLGAYVKKPFKPAVEYAGKHFKKGDIIAHTNMGTRHPFVYYWDNLWLQNLVFSQFYFSFLPAQDPYWRMIVKCGIDNHDPSYIELSTKVTLPWKRIWLISSSWARDGTLDANSIAAREWIDNNYRRTFERWFDGILMELYEKE